MPLTDVGTLVWVSVRSFPMWPGQVMDPTHARPTVRRKQRPGATLVSFFGDSSYGWFSEELMVGFEEHYEANSKQVAPPRLKEDFRVAVEEGKELLDRRKGLTPTTDHDPLDFLDPSAFNKLKDSKSDGLADGPTVSLATEADVNECAAPIAVAWLSCLAVASLESFQDYPPILEMAQRQLLSLSHERRGKAKPVARIRKRVDPIPDERAIYAAPKEKRPAEKKREEKKTVPHGRQPKQAPKKSQVDFDACPVVTCPGEDVVASLPASLSSFDADEPGTRPLTIGKTEATTTPKENAKSEDIEGHKDAAAKPQSSSPAAVTGTATKGATPGHQGVAYRGNLKPESLRAVGMLLKQLASEPMESLSKPNMRILQLSCLRLREVAFARGFGFGLKPKQTPSRTARNGQTSSARRLSQNRYPRAADGVKHRKPGAKVLKKPLPAGKDVPPGTSLADRNGILERMVAQNGNTGAPTTNSLANSVKMEVSVKGGHCAPEDMPLKLLKSATGKGIVSKSRSSGERNSGARKAKVGVTKLSSSAWAAAEDAAERKAVQSSPEVKQEAANAFVGKAATNASWTQPSEAHEVKQEDAKAPAGKATTNTKWTHPNEPQQAACEGGRRPRKTIVALRFPEDRDMPSQVQILMFGLRHDPDLEQANVSINAREKKAFIRYKHEGTAKKAAEVFKNKGPRRFHLPESSIQVCVVDRIERSEDSARVLKYSHRGSGDCKERGRKYPAQSTSRPVSNTRPSKFPWDNKIGVTPMVPKQQWLGEDDRRRRMESRLGHGQSSSKSMEKSTPPLDPRKVRMDGSNAQVQGLRSGREELVLHDSQKHDPTLRSEYPMQAGTAPHGFGISQNGGGGGSIGRVDGVTHIHARQLPGGFGQGPMNTGIMGPNQVLAGCQQFQQPQAGSVQMVFPQPGAQTASQGGAATGMHALAGANFSLMGSLQQPVPVGTGLVTQTVSGMGGRMPHMPQPGAFGPMVGHNAGGGAAPIHNTQPGATQQWPQPAMSTQPPIDQASMAYGGFNASSRAGTAAHILPSDINQPMGPSTPHAADVAARPGMGGTGPVHAVAWPPGNNGECLISTETEIGQSTQPTTKQRGCGNSADQHISINQRSSGEREGALDSEGRTAPQSREQQVEVEAGGRDVMDFLLQLAKSAKPSDA